jgi:DNA-directed RNA polymerase specialized sigma24 family protein
MPLTAHDLRYHLEQSCPLLYAYLHRNAQRFLGPLKYDAFEVDLVIGHVVEQLVRFGLLGGDDTTPPTALDRLSDAQFYAFLSRSIHNKAIDRLRKRRLQISSAAELEAPEGAESDDNPFGGAAESIWGTTPFSTPEEITLHLASQEALRNLLKHCIMALRAAPHQLQAVLQELHELGADDLIRAILDEYPISLASETNVHMSQHKDHAHRKLRHCLQQQSTNLTVMIALRLTEYGKRSADTQEYSVDVQMLAQDDLSQEDVRTGLNALATEGLLTWHGEDRVTLSTAQMRRLSRFYREEQE